MDKSEDTKETKKRRRFSFKTKLLLVETFLIIILLLTGWFLFDKLRTASRAQAQIGKLQSELKDCSSLLSSGSGDFGQFQYCTRLLQVFSQ